MTTAKPEADTLRNRKKARTKAAIQREALRLFAEQGYEATTVEEIADAVEVSRATFFRYFPAKADLVLHDIGDLTVLAALDGLPTDGDPVDRLREAITGLYDTAPEAGWTQNERRERLLRTVPELRARVPGHMAQAIPMLGEALARRYGRPTDDVEVLALSGAIVGVAIAVWTAGADDVAEGFIRRHLALLDAGLGRLRTGLAP
ncbi:hypothetical protein Afil01_33260 [Actinorhabdospora filicis]|uniref:HTH tetR-type domain-containing protein n=1 Tax=Actinorhabdospora filicis TaxID=1785913 RepID=A0A9W6SMH1_9ACTN|nr:TetR family transcriptional regulator [Actinorhabdospora filicis]GLZ78519.1 hypothetical protein Afil01_33260 [Actinorhabdospora filicis]